MSIKTALASHLKNEPTVQEKVGEDVYIQEVSTEATLPWIVIHGIGSNHVHHMTGASGVAMATLQVDCWDSDAILADELGEVVREALDTLMSTSIGLAPNAIQVHSATLVGQVDGLETPTHGTAPAKSVVHQTWTLWHTESVPTFA